jgi:ketosteroid isomerase-like protein
VRCVADGASTWAEWSWSGTRRAGEAFELRGVTILGVEDGRIANVRFYMEPLERAGAGIDAAIHEEVAGR